MFRVWKLILLIKAYVADNMYYLLVVTLHAYCCKCYFMFLLFKKKKKKKKKKNIFQNLFSPNINTLFTTLHFHTFSLLTILFTSHLIAKKKKKSLKETTTTTLIRLQTSSVSGGTHTRVHHPIPIRIRIGKIQTYSVCRAKNFTNNIKLYFVMYYIYFVLYFFFRNVIFFSFP